jgi:hypothetical protein
MRLGRESLCVGRIASGAMKPRLENIDLTGQDAAVLGFLGMRFGHIRVLDAHPSYLRADRRDAELMYRIEIARDYEREHPEAFVEYAGEGLVHCLVATVLRTGPVSFVDSDITCRA